MVFVISKIGETFINIWFALVKKKSIFGGIYGKQSFNKKTFPFTSLLLDGSTYIQSKVSLVSFKKSKPLIALVSIFFEFSCW